MTWVYFFLGCFVAPIVVGWILAQLIRPESDTKPFQSNMRANLIVFILALVGVVFIAVNNTATLEKDWIIPGGFLAVACVNLSLGVALVRRKRKLASAQARQSESKSHNSAP